MERLNESGVESDVENAVREMGSCFGLSGASI